MANRILISDGVQQYRGALNEAFDQAGLSGAGTVRRGKSIIDTTETITGATVSTYMPTPDRVQNVVLPSGGLLVVAFQALWNSHSDNVFAGIYLSGTPIVTAIDDVFPNDTYAAQAARVNTAYYTNLSSYGGGLTSARDSGADAVQATGGAGQVVGIHTANSSGGIDEAPLPNHGDHGPCYIFVDAGTYEVGIKYITGGGASVSTKKRKLWVWTMGF